MLWKNQLVAAAFLLSVGSLWSGTIPVPDKSAYTLFNRVPESLLRDLSTDRPDLTESPYTVDAGWAQVEMDLFAYARDHDKADGEDLKATAFAVANINFKFGLTSKIDLQTVIEPYTKVRITDHVSGVKETISGFGDVTSRLKINFWGNDGGDTAFALMPFVKWPTNQHGLGNNYVEGGLIVPLAMSLGGGWDMGVMTEFDIVRNETNTGYALDWVNSVTCSHDIAGKLGGYVELATTLTRGRDLASFDCGLTYGVNRNLQLDAGLTVGLTHATEDLLVFTGISLRF